MHTPRGGGHLCRVVIRPPRRPGQGSGMTATARRLAPVALPPAVRAQIVLWAVLAANVLVVEILFVTSGEGKNALLSVAKFFGLHAALLMLLQFLLVARLPWLDRRIGMDRLTVWHRWVGFTLLWTVLLHASFILLGYSRLDGLPV